MGNLCSQIETVSPQLSASPCGEIVIFPDDTHLPRDALSVSPLRVSGSIIRVPAANPVHLTIPMNDGDHPGDIQIEVPEQKEMNGSGGVFQAGDVLQNTDSSKTVPKLKAPSFSPLPERKTSDGIENVGPGTGFQQIDSELEKPVRWKKGDLIGAGAYGRVYLGLNEDTGSLMAVKQVPMPTEEAGKGSKAKVAEFVQGLEAEVGVLKQFKHPNIVRYLGTDCDGSTLNIFLEYVAGGSVASLLVKFGTFQENLVRVFTKQILTGLEFLHKNKIAHRDIKGGNILVDHLGVVKLADFGASKTIVNLVTMNTGFKSLKGTPYWMAPEVIKQTGKQAKQAKHP